MRPHLEVLNRRMVDLAARRIRRQATFIPPRHGKSEFRSKYFPAWYLGTFPTHRVILACNTIDLAEEFGRSVRRILEEWGPSIFGVTVSQERRSAANWALDQGGSMVCVGVGGAIVGRGADLFLIDDPIRSAEEALSPTVQRKHADWFASEARSRLEPDGVMCFTSTPWHSLDLSGLIMSGDLGEWDILRLPALAEEDDPLGRAEGEALWPGRYSAEDLEETRRINPFWFDALYQCRPRARDGGFFKTDWFEGKVVSHAPPNAVARVRYWDRAASLGKGDWTVGVKIARTANNLFYVEDVIRGRWMGHERDALMRATAEFDGPACRVGYEQEPGSSGKAEAEALARMFAGFPVSYAPASGAKEVRVAPFASQCQAGNVFLVAGAWNGPFVSECCDFPTGRNDDQPDAAGGGFNLLAKAPPGFPDVVGGPPLVARGTLADPLRVPIAPIRSY